MSTPAPPSTPQMFPVSREPLALTEEALDRAYLPRSDYFDDGDSSANRSLFRVTAQGVAVIDVAGVIDSRASWFWTGYDEVQGLVSLAMEHASVAAVVLCLDSPGGVAAGMVDTGRALRAMADRAGKPLVAHAGPMACSAAYGLACAADKILVTEDGTVGSIGVIAVTTDRTAQNAANGIVRTVIASGTMKADGHPDQPQTSAALSRMRARVMQLAGMFGAWVATRRGMTPEAVMALQGACAYGADAVTKGLADQVGTLADAIATAAQLAADSATKRKPTPGMPGMAASGTLGVRSMADAAITDDRGFIDAMIPHHEVALAMVEKADGKLKNADLKKLAAGIKAAQTAEIAEMERIRGALPPKKTAAALAADSAARTKEKTMDTNAAKSLATTDTIRAALGVATDDELPAAVATLKLRADQGAEAARELAAVRAQLATRDQADAQKARAEVMAKHEARGALTPAMKANAAYMETLATLTAPQLDANLSCLPSLVREPAQPRIAGTNPSGESTDPTTVDLTPEEKEWCAKFGQSEAAALADKRAELAKRIARAG